MSTDPAARSTSPFQAPLSVEGSPERTTRIRSVAFLSLPSDPPLPTSLSSSHQVTEGSSARPFPHTFTGVALDHSSMPSQIPNNESIDPSLFSHSTASFPSSGVLGQAMALSNIATLLGSVASSSAPTPSALIPGLSRSQTPNK